MRSTAFALVLLSLVACDRRAAGGSPDGGATPPGPGAGSPDAPSHPDASATTTAAGGEAPASDAGAPAETCGDATCKPGQQCISYYGIAGPRGPEFRSCEWPCAKGQACPEGTRCVTVADGPGQVCR